jgi:quercetin dioxygenase-like cupin family protein
MRVNNQRGGTQHGDKQYFTGEVWQDELAVPGEDTRLSMFRVTFAPGARATWHKHPSGQILHVVAGAGLIQAHGGEVTSLSAGDTVIAPAGEWHWHGATADAMMTMISVQGADADGVVVYWGTPPADGAASA